MRMELYPPNGDDPLVFDWDQRLTIPRIEGLSEAGIAPITAGAPGQFGESLLDVNVGMRIIALTCAYRAADQADQWAMRRRLTRACFTPPRRRDEVPKLGLFRCYPPGAAPVEVEVLPRNGPQIDAKGPLGFYADVELVAPYPYWRETTDRFVRLEVGGGFTFPLRFPLTMRAYNTQAEIVNDGDVPVGVLIRLYGGATTPRLRQLTTGETIEIAGAVAQGSYVEIDTRFARKNVELIDATGIRQRIMGRLNLARSDFPWLDAGRNTLRFEADVTAAGAAATVHWRGERSGV